MIKKGALVPIHSAPLFLLIRGSNMNYTKDEINDDVNEDSEDIDDEELRRFLRGGFGAK